MPYELLTGHSLGEPWTANMVMTEPILRKSNDPPVWIASGTEPPENNDGDFGDDDNDDDGHGIFIVMLIALIVVALGTLVTIFLWK